MKTSAHPQINHGHVIAVSLSDNGCQVLKVWWQEGSVCGGEPHGACLLVTLEVCSADATHISFKRGVQCYEMKLDERESILSHTWCALHYRWNIKSERPPVSQFIFTLWVWNWASFATSMPNMCLDSPQRLHWNAVVAGYNCAGILCFPPAAPVQQKSWISVFLKNKNKKTTTLN